MSPTLTDLFRLPLADLHARAKAARLGLPARPWREGLVSALSEQERTTDQPAFGCGVLEVHDEGFGFLRSPYADFEPGADDIYVSQSQIRRFHLRTGDAVIGRTRPPKEQERYPALLRVELVNGATPEEPTTPFEEQAVVGLSARWALAGHADLAALDHLAPLGRGARGLLIGGDPMSRRRMLGALVDRLRPQADAVWLHAAAERPEEIAEWRALSDVMVVATAFDAASNRHTHAVDLTLAAARRQAERGQHVVVLIDGLSRLLRHAVAEQPGTGRVLDGVEAAALHRVRGWLGSGRALEPGGSLTVLATLHGDDTYARAARRDLADALTWQATLRDHSSVPQLDPVATHAWRPERLIGEASATALGAWRASLSVDPHAQDEALRAVVP